MNSNLTHRMVTSIKLLLVFVYELFKASMKVSIAVLRGKAGVQPEILYFPLTCKSDVQITMLANLISLTPGTLTLEVTHDKQYLLIHSMFFEEKTKWLNELRVKFEQPIIEVFS